MIVVKTVRNNETWVEKLRGLLIVNYLIMS